MKKFAKRKKIRGKREDTLKARGKFIPAITNIIIVIASILVDVIVFEAIKEQMSSSIFYSMVGISAIIVLFEIFVVWIILAYVFMRNNSDTHIGGEKHCEYEDHACCGYLAIQRFIQNYDIIQLNEETRLNDEYSLYTQSYILDVEENLSSTSDEIWILSSNLDSELDGGATEIVKKNLKLGIKYKYFYLREKNDSEYIKRNIAIMKANFIPYSSDDKLNFIPIENANKDLGEYTAYLFGVVIYIHNGACGAVKYEAYFSIRNTDINSTAEPIYYKMPICMAGRYYEYLQEAEHKSSEKLDIHIKQLNMDDLSAVKKFVLQEHNSLERKEFFIIDDIDVALPRALSTDGVMYSVMEDNNIVSIQAIDWSDNINKEFHTLLGDIVDQQARLIEIGWSMTNEKYRRKKYLTSLSSQLQIACLAKFDNAVLIATVHPDNRKALQAYLSQGFSVILLTTWHGLPRNVLMKDIRNKNYN